MSDSEPHNIPGLLRSSSRPRVPLLGGNIRRAFTPAMLLLMLFAILFPTGQLQAAVERTALDNGGPSLQQPAPSGNEGGQPESESDPDPDPEPVPAPDTPSSVSVTRADGSLTASWPAVKHATSYHVTYSSDGGASWDPRRPQPPFDRLRDGQHHRNRPRQRLDLRRRRPRPQRQRRQRLAQLPTPPAPFVAAHACPYPDAGAYRDAYPDTRPDGDAHAGAGTYRDAHADAGAYRNADGDSRTYRNTHGHAGTY